MVDLLMKLSMVVMRLLGRFLLSLRCGYRLCLVGSVFVDEHVAKEYECSTLILDTSGFCSKELDIWDFDTADRG